MDAGCPLAWGRLQTGWTSSDCQLDMARLRPVHVLHTSIISWMELLCLSVNKLPTENTTKVRLHSLHISKLLTMIWLNSVIAVYCRSSKIFSVKNVKLQYNVLPKRNFPIFLALQLAYELQKRNFPIFLALQLAYELSDIVSYIIIHNSTIILKSDATTHNGRG